MTCFIQAFLAKVEQEDSARVAAILASQTKTKKPKPKNRCLFCLKELPEGMDPRDHDCVPF